MPLRLATAFAIIIAASVPALSQETFPACETQQDLEQLIQSDGQIVPDACRTLSIARIETDEGELCALDFEEQDPGVLDTLTQAALPTQWWVACDNLMVR